MKKTVIGIITAAAVLGALSAGCGRQEIQETQETQETQEEKEIQETQETQEIQEEQENTGEEIISGEDTSLVAEKAEEEESEEGTAQGGESELTYDEMWARFYEKSYNGVSWEEIEDRLKERMAYYQASGYYEVMQDYWENIREVRDVANRVDPLYFTDMKYYTAGDFSDDPPEVIHLAKNEIYAKHGYIFEDADLNNYFMGCTWYEPVYSSDEFDDAVFNDYEKKNLELLTGLDNY